MPISPLRYPGGKTRAIKHIEPFIPQGIDSLCSPFLGGGSLEIHISNTRNIPVHGSDAFVPLVNFWYHALHNIDELTHEVLKLYPMEHNEFYRLQETMRHFHFGVESAAGFFALNRSSFSGTTMSGGISPGTPRFNRGSISRLAAFCAPNLHTSGMGWEDALSMNPGKFLYLDPPYDIPQRLYGNNGDWHWSMNHDRLAEVLRERTGWVLSYNNSNTVVSRYRDIPGVKIGTPDWTHGMSLSGHRNGKEILIVRN